MNNNNTSLLRSIFFLELFEAGGLPVLPILLVLCVASPFLVVYGIGKALYCQSQRRSLYPEELADRASTDPAAKRRIEEGYYDSYEWSEELERRRCVAYFQTRPM